MKNNMAKFTITYCYIKNWFVRLVMNFMSRGTRRAVVYANNLEEAVATIKLYDDEFVKIVPDEVVIEEQKQ